MIFRGKLKPVDHPNARSGEGVHRDERFQRLLQANRLSDQFFRVQFHEALDYANGVEKMGLHLAERKLIGIDHCEVAAMLLTRWKFPARIIDPIALHHEREMPQGESAIDVALLRVANILARELAIGKDGNPSPHEVYGSDLELLEMEQKDLDDMREYSEGITDDIQFLFASMI